MLCPKLCQQCAKDYAKSVQGCATRASGVMPRVCRNVPAVCQELHQECAGLCHPCARDHARIMQSCARGQTKSVQGHAGRVRVHLQEFHLCSVGTLSAAQPNAQQLARLGHAEYNLIMTVFVHPAVVCVQAAGALCSHHGVLHTHHPGKVQLLSLFWSCAFLA